MPLLRWTLIAALVLAGVACETIDDESGDTVDGAAEELTGVDCSETALNDGDEEYVFTSAYRVDDGELGALCFGDADPIVVDAWEALATITPTAQLSDLVLFGGFEPDGPPADETLAFVNAVDSDGSGFQMSINTIDAAADPDELLLTIAHEFAVEPATDGQAERLDWIETQPGLVEFRDNAELAGASPLSNNFDICGF